MNASATVPFNWLTYLELAIARIASTVEGFGTSFEPCVRTADLRFGDYQINGVLMFAKTTQSNPRVLAAALLAALQISEPYFQNQLMTAELAGPGFINIRLAPKLLTEWIQQYSTYDSISHEAAKLQSGKTVVIDYSSPNTAKQLHVGHMRSIVIGEALQRLLKFSGAKVIRINHIGDWGTQFGVLLMAIKHFEYNLDSEHPDILADLEAIYKKGSALTLEQPAFLDIARQELVKLQNKDPENLRLWKAINQKSYEAFQIIYDQFGVIFDHVMGESCYTDTIDRVYKELMECGIAEESQGALVVFHKEHPQFKTFPFIIRKSDSATNYATTDLATVLYRCKHFKADEIIYVTDGRQQDHFQQLQLTTKKWFAAKNYRLANMRHVWFGTVLGADGKAIKTRSGENIKLQALVTEAIERATAIIEIKSKHLPQKEKEHIAHTIGIAALQYADLSQNRTSDYVFCWDKLLSFEGNTAAYLLYAGARIHSIFRKLADTSEIPAVSTEVGRITTDAEMNLARQLIHFPVVLNSVLEDLRPHYICTYLFELIGTFSTFYNADKIVGSEPSIVATRTLLCKQTLTILETSLELLGIRTLEKM